MYAHSRLAGATAFATEGDWTLTAQAYALLCSAKHSWTFQPLLPMRSGAIAFPQRPLTSRKGRLWLPYGS